MHFAAAAAVYGCGDLRPFAWSQRRSSFRSVRRTAGTLVLRASVRHGCTRVASDRAKRMGNRPGLI